MNNRPVIGWEKETPVPEGHRFNDYLTVKNGRLHLDGLDLAALFSGEGEFAGLTRPAGGALELVYLPLIRRRIAEMKSAFAAAADEVGYNGRLIYTYASKANVAEEIVRTTLGGGAHHEMSSTVDVDVIRIMIRRGILTPDKYVVCNGFKVPGSSYSNNIIRLREKHEKLLPVLEDLVEIPPFIESGHQFQVGLRQKTYGHNKTLEEMDNANSRFGLTSDAMWQAAQMIDDAPNLTLTLHHAMVGSQLVDGNDFLARLSPGMEMYAQLRQRYPSLHIFNFGGGMPVAMTLDFDFDYRAFAVRLLTKLKETCARYGVPEPDVMGEFGRYTTAEHGAHFFKVITVKENNSTYPWYVIDGSIMTAFPDSWALSEHFILLPLNHLDKPFHRVQLGGTTCDSDDVYPPKPSKSPLYLPMETTDLVVGFFGIGAYQEMLGGVGGSKHCVLPEAYELVVDVGADGRYQFQSIPGQTPTDVLRNLGYRRG